MRLSPSSGLLSRLLAEGWGRAWGIYLASGASPLKVRRSLRRLLMVAADTERHPLYFRFYDPRVLRRFVPLATAKQRTQFLAASEAIFYENADASLAELTRDGSEAGPLVEELT